MYTCMTQNSIRYIQSKLKPALAKIASRRKLGVHGTITHLFEIYFVTVIISLFIGLKNVSVWGISGRLPVYAYISCAGVLSIVILRIMNKQIKSIFRWTSSQALKNNSFVVFLYHFHRRLVLELPVLFYRHTLFRHRNERLVYAEMDRRHWFNIYCDGPYFLIKKRVETNFNAAYQKALFEAVVLRGYRLQIRRCCRHPAIAVRRKQIILPTGKYMVIAAVCWWRATPKIYVASRPGSSATEVTQSGGKTETKNRPFRGFMLVVDFNKSFSGETYIFPIPPEKPSEKFMANTSIKYFTENKPNW